jgi:hypothetical protein
MTYTVASAPSLLILLGGERDGGDAETVSGDR